MLYTTWLSEFKASLPVFSGELTIKGLEGSSASKLRPNHSHITPAQHKTLNLIFFLLSIWHKKKEEVENLLNITGYWSL